MVTTIILALCIPVTCLVMGFFILQGFKLGLKVNKQELSLDQSVLETKEVKIEPVEDKPTDKAQVHEVINEWLYGAER